LLKIDIKIILKKYNKVYYYKISHFFILLSFNQNFQTNVLFGWRIDFNEFEWIVCGW